MTNLILEETETELDKQEGYTRLGLRDNPFPIEGIINPINGDPRINGAIFATQVRQRVIEEFELTLLGVGNPEQRYRLGYVWAQGDQARGRGVGKTALLLHLREKINRGWGSHYFQGHYPVCALYVYPQQGMNRLEYVAVLALRELVEQKVIESAVTNLRYRAITRLWPAGEAKVVKALTPQEGHLLLDAVWLTQHGFELEALNGKVVALLTTAGVQEEFARAVADLDLLTHLKSFRRDHQLDFPPPPRDLALYRKANNLFFTQALRTLKVAGFKGAYLFIDDLENMLDKMSRSEREGFAKELGYILLRGEYEAGVSRFLTMVLTTHVAAAQRLSEAWSFAGLQSSLPMSLDAPNSILVPVMDVMEAKAIIKLYLDHFRLNPSENDYHPFTEEAITVLVQHCNYHPREFLAKSHQIIEQARLTFELTAIDAAFVTVCLKNTNGASIGSEDNIDISLL